MLGKPVEEDLTDDGWTQPLRRGPEPAQAQGHDARGVPPQRRGDRLRDHGGRTAAGSRSWWRDPDAAEVAQAVLPVPLQAALLPRRVPAGVQQPQRHARRLPGRHRPGHRARARSSTASSTRSTASSTAPASRPSSRRCTAEPATTSSAGTASRLADKWADGAASLFGMMSRGFPNLFVMPAPGQQAVVTVNYTQLAVLGRRVRRPRRRPPRQAGASRCFDVSAEAEEQWTEKIVESFVDASAVMAACTPSRINLEGNPQAMNPRNGNYGRGLGDYFGYRDAARAVAGRTATARASSSTHRQASEAVGRRRTGRKRVAVVTGGGGGIGAAIAEELGRAGAFVVTIDPLVIRRRLRAAPGAGGDDGRSHRRRRRLGAGLVGLGDRR